MSEVTLWWVLAGAAVAVELATGTFYLLMMALGLGAGALAAHAGLGLPGQLVAAAVVGGGAVAAWHLKRSRQPNAAPAERNRDVNLDVGERVQVLAWDAHGNAQAAYRGAVWAVRYQGQGTPAPGEFVIQAVEGNRLIVG
jgi:membrane protein implicated in regulation of membrane protease activity